MGHAVVLVGLALQGALLLRRTPVDRSKLVALAIEGAGYAMLALSLG